MKKAYESPEFLKLAFTAEENVADTLSFGDVEGSGDGLPLDDTGE